MVDSYINDKSGLNDSYMKGLKNTHSMKPNQHDSLSRSQKQKQSKDKKHFREVWETRLFSVGEDNFLFEYNVAKSKTKLEVESYLQVENQNVPQCFIEYSDEMFEGPNKGFLIANQGTNIMQRLQVEALERKQRRLF